MKNDNNNKDFPSLINSQQNQSFSSTQNQNQTDNFSQAFPSLLEQPIKQNNQKNNFKINKYINQNQAQIPQQNIDNFINPNLVQSYNSTSNQYPSQSSQNQNQDINQNKKSQNNNENINNTQNDNSKQQSDQKKPKKQLNLLGKQQQLDSINFQPNQNILNQFIQQLQEEPQIKNNDQIVNQENEQKIKKKKKNKKNKQKNQEVDQNDINNTLVQNQDIQNKDQKNENIQNKEQKYQKSQEQNKQIDITNENQKKVTFYEQRQQKKLEKQKRDLEIQKQLNDLKQPDTQKIVNEQDLKKIQKQQKQKQQKKKKEFIFEWQDALKAQKLQQMQKNNKPNKTHQNYITENNENNNKDTINLKVQKNNYLEDQQLQNQNKDNKNNSNCKENNEDNDWIDQDKEEIELDRILKLLKQINEFEIEQQQNQQPGQWDQDISIKSLEKKKNLLAKKEMLIKKSQNLQQKIQNKNELRQKRIEEEKLQKIQQLKEKNNRKKQKKFENIIKIAKEVYKYRQDKNLPQPQKGPVKYKSVPAHTLDFNLVEKKKVRKSKVKDALKLYSELKNQNQEKQLNSINKKFEFDDQIEENSNLQLQQLQQNQIQDQNNNEDNFITVAECTDNETHLVKSLIPYQLKKVHNFQDGTKYNNITLRHWVDHIPCQELDSKIVQFINKLSYKQAMKKLTEPLKYKKRVVAGFREVKKSLRLNLQEFKSRCIVIALNLQENPLKGGSDQLVEEIITLAQSKNIPVFHASTRARLGCAFKGKFGTRIACLSVINYSSMESQFKDLLEILQIQKKQFHDKNFENI